MLPKKNRNNKKEVSEIFKKGRTVSSHFLVLKYLKNKPLFKKISFITPKNISKNSTKRNLLRRRGYSILAKNLKRLPEGFSGVFLFQKGSQDFFGGRKKKEYKPIQNLENEIEIIFNKIN